MDDDDWILPDPRFVDSPPPEPLTPKQEERLRAVHEYVAPYTGETFEQFAADFAGEEDPDRDIDVWAELVLAHHEFVTANPGAHAGDAFRCLLKLSGGAERPPADLPAGLWEAVRRQCLGEPPPE